MLLPVTALSFNKQSMLVVAEVLLYPLTIFAQCVAQSRSRCTKMLPGCLWADADCPAEVRETPCKTLPAHLPIRDRSDQSGKNDANAAVGITWTRLAPFPKVELQNPDTDLLGEPDIRL